MSDHEARKNLRERLPLFFAGKAGKHLVQAAKLLITDITRFKSYTRFLEHPGNDWLNR